MRLALSVVVLCGLLAGCASSRSPLADAIRMLVDTGGTGVVAPTIPDVPDPRYRYLRVQVAGHPPGLLALGYVDASALGPVEVWYSGSKEALRLLNGRIVGATGTLVEWQAVQFTPPPPPWPDVPPNGSTYMRQRDTMPGYRYGIQESVQLQTWSGLPPIALSASLPPDKARRYQWFRETTTPSNTATGLPPAWFAWGRHLGVNTIVYSEQCLAADFCVQLQRWPLREEAP